MGTVFAWMRPDDLVFSYVVINWLMGEEPPVFDILAWNADGTNLPACLHEQFLGIFRDNSLTRPGRVSVLGTPVELSNIDVPRPDPGAWRDIADRRTGSWWEAWSAWVLERSGERTSPPEHLGDDAHPPLEPAPGSYVLGRVPTAGSAPSGRPVAAASGRR